MEYRLLTGWHKLAVVLAWGINGLAGWSSPVFAQAVPRPTEVNTEYSRVYVFVDKSSALGHQHAIEGMVAQGNLSFRADSKGKLLFDLKSFDADTLRARQYVGLEGSTDESTRVKVNANMHGSEVLNLSKFPEARLDEIALQPRTTQSKRGLPEYVMSGIFSLHGTRRPIEALCDLEMKDGWHHLRGSFKIKQSDFSMKPFSKLMGTIGVADELVILGDLWIVPE